jgi:hypothetical protein
LVRTDSDRFRGLVAVFPVEDSPRLDSTADLAGTLSVPFRDPAAVFPAGDFPHLDLTAVVLVDSVAAVSVARASAVFMVVAAGWVVSTAVAVLEVATVVAEATDD